MVDSYFAQTRDEMLKYLPAKVARILDVGCGEGVFAELVKKRKNCEAWGIEINANAAESARKRIDKVYVGDIDEQIDILSEAAFDVIFFNDVLEHLPAPEVVLQRIASLLTPGGVIIASIPNVRHFPTLFKLVVKRDWKYMDSGILDRTHLRFFTFKSARRMFESCGYEVVSMEGINSLPSLKFMPINIITLGFLSDTRFLQFAVVAKPRLNGVS